MVSFQQLTKEELATDNFVEDWMGGRGGFGLVYAGYVRGSKVAIKCLTLEGGAQLKPELAALKR